jgi:hypothetical protein
MNMENLTLTKQPLRTLHFFLLAMLQYLKRLATYILSKGGFFFLLIALLVASGILLAVSDGQNKKVCCMSFSCLCLNLWDMDSHFHRNACCCIFYSILVLYLSTNVVWLTCMQHVQEFLNYAKFVLWWISLGVASSIGLGKLYFRTSKHCGL